MSPKTSRSLAAAVLGAMVLANCSGSAYKPSYGFILETQYENGIPSDQQRALADGFLTEAEVERATRASDACVAAVAGIASVEPFRWVEQDGEFSGGNVEIEKGADEVAALDQARACYFKHVGLIEFAWLDQWYFGSWTDENLRN